MGISEPWLAEACELKIAFAQVREDAALDLKVVRLAASEATSKKPDVLLVASGGCTAAALASLAAGSIGRLHLVDQNPAQIALARLKLRLLENFAPAERLALLGHTPLDAEQRAWSLTRELNSLGLTLDDLGPPELIARWGPDHAGRYERLFARLRERLNDQIAPLTALLELGDASEQARRAAPDTELGRALDQAYDEVLALPHLVQLFGEGATQNRIEPFSRHFLRRTRHVLATLPADSNPYLWQMLLGRFPKDVPFPWISATCPDALPTVTWSVTAMADALRTHADQFDVVHLSNILDWLSPDEARQTLSLAFCALRPGGWVVIRQLNSTLDIPALGSSFAWLADAAVAMHARDRSFFYRALHLGRKAE